MKEFPVKTAEDEVEGYDVLITTTLLGSVTTKKYPDAPDTRLHDIVMEVLEKFEGRGDAEAKKGKGEEKKKKKKKKGNEKKTKEEEKEKDKEEGQLE